ncbi:MAG: membrane protein [Acidimicrobiales bacterium]|nr:MAG: membrane protein [Acidimicrobiales bacterium]
MTFLAPHRLWLLIAVALLAVAYVMVSATRRRYALRFSTTPLLREVAPRRPGWRRHVVAVLQLVALCTLVAAYAKPAREVTVARERATLVLAIDTSLSMGADDVRPDRVTVAKRAATEFVRNLPPTLNVGLVSFNGVATINVTPTLDHELVADAIEKLELGKATAIGDAILASLAALETVPASEDGRPPPARILLMSDGENTTGTPVEDAVADARLAGVPIFTIAFGTEVGTITLPEVGEVDVRVDRETLRQIADSTGGEYFEAASFDELRRVYEDIGSSVGAEKEFREVTDEAAALALVTAMIAGLLSLLWFSRIP